MASSASSYSVQDKIAYLLRLKHSSKLGPDRCMNFGADANTNIRK